MPDPERTQGLEHRNLGGEKLEEYVMAKWAGLNHYRCKKCAFDTLDLRGMLMHLVEQHNSEAALDELFPASEAPLTSPKYRQRTPSI